MSRMPAVLAVICAALMCPSAARAAAVGAPADVAPGVPGTRSQMWPTAAWSEGAKCWLVAWREGDITEDDSDVWCARVSADGRALDPAGIRVCGAKDRQDRPRIASDGKDFLVVWEDFRNGNDYDVYAARVSGAGQVLDAEAFLVAGGEHNQCRPAVAFAGGCYFVAWSEFRGDGVPGDDDGATGYRLRGLRMGGDGKPRGETAELAILDGKLCSDAFSPVLASCGEEIAVAYCLSGPKGKRTRKDMAVQRLNAGTGQLQGAAFPFGVEPDRAALLPAIALASGGGLAAVSRKAWITDVLRLDASGKPTGERVSITEGSKTGPTPLLSGAFDGQRYLLTMDVGESLGRDSVRARVMGLSIPAAGDMKGISEKDLFVIAGDGDNNQMQGFAAAGPRGACLVVYCEIRGADDVKVLARVVK